MKSSVQSLAAINAGKSDQVPLIAHYLGSLSTEQALIKDSLINTDDLPWIEYLAPESHRAVRAGKVDWFVEDSLLAFMRDLQAQSPSVSDPFLKLMPAEIHRAVSAGLYLHEAAVARDREDTAAASEALAKARALLTPSQSG
ncbi:MAG: hypothetical protein JJ934_17140 [Pseudomonadales bacterium]|nr:hypothetical protein [Pseudomonadales bacterium]